MFPFATDEADWDKEIEDDIRKSMNEVDDRLCRSGPSGCQAATTESGVRSHSRRIRPDQQVVQSHEAVADEWRPAGLCMSIIGHQQTETNSNSSAAADAMAVDEGCVEEETICSHGHDIDCFTKLFECIEGSHPSITEAFLSQFKPQAILHPQLQQDAAKEIVKAVWPEVIHNLQPELEKQLPVADASPLPHQPQSAPCNAAALPFESRPEPLMSSPIYSQPLADLPDLPTQALEPSSHVVDQGQDNKAVDTSPRPTADMTAEDPPSGQALHFQFPHPASAHDSSRAYSTTMAGALEQHHMHTRAPPPAKRHSDTAAHTHTRAAPSAKRHSDTAAVIGVPQPVGQSRFRSPGEAIRSQSVTNGRPRWQRWVGVQARLTSGQLAHAMPAEPVFSDLSAPALTRSASAPRSHSAFAAPPTLTAGLAAMSFAHASTPSDSAPSPDALPLLPLPRDPPVECRVVRRGASAVEVPSPRLACGHAVAEGCAEGRLGGMLAAADNNRCGMVLSSSPRVSAYGRGGAQLKAPSLWKHDQSPFRVGPPPVRDPFMPSPRRSPLPPTPPQQRTPRSASHVSPREAAKATVAAEHRICAAAAAASPLPATAADTIPTTPRQEGPLATALAGGVAATSQGSVAAEAARRAAVLREEFRKSLASLRVPQMRSHPDSSGEMTSVQSTPR